MIYSVRSRLSNVCDYEVFTAAIKGGTRENYFKIRLIFYEKHNIKGKYSRMVNQRHGGKDVQWIAGSVLYDK